MTYEKSRNMWLYVYLIIF